MTAVMRMSVSVLRPSRTGLCRRCIFMANLPHGREIQGSLGVRSLSILRLVRLNGLSVAYTSTASLHRQLLRITALEKLHARQ